MKSVFLNRFLLGLKGVEIGGSSGPGDYGLDVINVDHPGGSIFNTEQLRHAPAVRKVDIVADACSIPLPNDSYEFVFSSHVLEHLPDPILALQEQYRIATRYIAMVVPQRNALVLDSQRPLTTLTELKNRWNKSPEGTYSLFEHLSIWRVEDMLELISWGNSQKIWNFTVRGVLNPDDARGDGWIVILEVIKS